MWLVRVVFGGVGVAVTIVVDGEWWVAVVDFGVVGEVFGEEFGRGFSGVVEFVVFGDGVGEFVVDFGAVGSVPPCSGEACLEVGFVVEEDVRVGAVASGETFDGDFADAFRGDGASVSAFAVVPVTGVVAAGSVAGVFEVDGVVDAAGDG